MKNCAIFLTLVVFIAVVASCAAPIVDESVEYTLTISSTEGGKVTIPGEGVFTYQADTVVELLAEPEEGYRFVNWTGNATTIGDRRLPLTTVRIDDHFAINADFVAQYTLTIESSEGGAVAVPGQGVFVYDVGVVVNLVAEAEEGYKFMTWTGDVGSIADVNAGSTTIAVDGDYSIYAEFTRAHVYYDKIGPGPWGLFVVGGGVEAAVTEDGVLVSMGSDSVGVGERQHFGAGGMSQYAVEGDFDIRMGFELTGWPQGSGVRVGIMLRIPDDPGGGVNVERVGFGDADVDFPGEPREVYLVNFEREVDGITGTDDLSGTLRIRREGTTIRCYYATGEGWYQIYEKEWSAEGTYVYVATWSQDFYFGEKDVRLLLGTAEIVTP